MGYLKAACWGKASYASHADAVTAIALIREREGLACKHGLGSLVPYRCRACHDWHIGSGGQPFDPRVDPKRWKNWHWRDQAEN
jgi:GH24 family phage-related lysozyme (muramidase)